MKQIVEKENKSTIKIFMVIIFFVIIVDLIIFIMNRFTKSFPYMTSLTTIFGVVISCIFILTKYFSKYVYALEGRQLIFTRAIGKRRFEILKIDYEDLIDIKPYNKDIKNESYSYNFTFDKKGEGVYMGKFRGNNKTIGFLFRPNESILKELKRVKK